MVFWRDGRRLPFSLPDLSSDADILQKPLTLEEINKLTFEAAYLDFQKCCGARQWVAQMADRRPFRSRDDLMTAADTIWQALEPSEWKNAFGHHPRIGDLESLKEKFSSTAAWAEGEQSGVRTASDEILVKLAAGNKEYEEKFGYRFIVCASGKSADEMHLLLEQRLQNDPEHELTIAAEEHRKITRIRLERLLA